MIMDVIYFRGDGLGFPVCVQEVYVYERFMISCMCLYTCGYIASLTLRIEASRMWVSEAPPWGPRSTSTVRRVSCSRACTTCAPPAPSLVDHDAEGLPRPPLRTAPT